jgi:tetratricopeptide (TPR) repeat protein
LKEKERVLQFSIGNLESEVYGVQILKDDILLKEPRLWHKGLNIHFKNPVFEKLNADFTKMLDIILYQHEVYDDRTKVILKRWDKAKPFSMDCYYYRAFESLVDKNVNEFKSLITYYLFNSKKEDIPSTMARYYLAMIQGLGDNNVNTAIQNLIFCIAAYPLMAEFWCLLGDIFVKNDDYERAIEFYRNSIILGNRRLKTDLWPMQLSKYKEYPNDMIGKCHMVLSTSKKLTITVT